MRDTNHPFTRRSLVRASGAFLVVSTAGCLGFGDDSDQSDDDDDVDDTGDTDDTDDAGSVSDDVSDDDVSQGDDTTANGSSDATDDDSEQGSDDMADNASDDAEQSFELPDEFDSYVSETEITQIFADESETVHSLYLEVDLAAERVYKQIETVDQNGNPIVLEAYHIEDTTYQVLPDGSCTVWEMDGADAGIEVDEIEIPDPEAIDEIAAEFVYAGTDTIDGEEVHVWVYDLAETKQEIAGEITVYLSTASGYPIGVDGWATVDSDDEISEVRFEQRNHQFNEELTIELPEACEE